MSKLTTFNDNENIITRNANYINNARNNKKKNHNHYSKKLKFMTTINLIIIYCLLIIIISPNYVVSQITQKDSDPTVTIPRMKWINLNSQYSNSSVLVPPGLKDFAFGFDVDLRRVVIYGGSAAGGTVSDETYLLDLNTMIWSASTGITGTKYAPSPRTKMFYGRDIWSSYRNELVIFGGKGNGDIAYGDIWSYNIPYKTWTNIGRVTQSNPPLPPMYDGVGGIDNTLVASGALGNNTMWITHGTDGKQLFRDVWALSFAGSWAPNNSALEVNVTKVDMSSSTSFIPSGRVEVGGTILPNNRMVMYGGCNSTSTTCALPDTFSLALNSDGVTIPDYSAKPIWSKQNMCLGSRDGPAMAMVGKKPYDTIAVVFGGKAANGSAVGGDGEVGILDSNLGVWVRVLPEPDDLQRFPKARAGARMLSAPVSLFKDGQDAGQDIVDILLYGGEALDGSSTNYNDMWILRLYTATPVSKLKPLSNSTMKFLECVVEDTKASYTPTSTDSPTTTGGHTSTSTLVPNEDANFSYSAMVGHTAFSVTAYLLLLVSSSVIRFGYNSDSKFLVGASYTILVVLSYAMAFYGFGIAFIEIRDKSNSHFASAHGLLGVIILILLYLLVPFLALVILFMSKSLESSSSNNNDNNNNNNNDDNNNNNENLSKSKNRDYNDDSSSDGFLNKFTSIFRKGSGYSGNGKPTFEVTRPSSIMKTGNNDNDWMEQRKSISIADNRRNSFGLRDNNSMQNVSSLNNTSSSENRLGSGVGYGFAANNGQHKKNNSSSSNASGSSKGKSNESNHIVIVTRHIFHIISQFILILGAIYIAIYLESKNSISSVYFIAFVVIVAFFYLIWIFAAWFGYPKERRSLLVSLAAKYCGGKGESSSYSEHEDRERNSTASIPSSMNTNANIPKKIINNNSSNNNNDDIDEDAETEQEMMNREVVVMTIPKRRLAVVNA